MTGRTRIANYQDLADFILSEDKDFLLTDACKARILDQFLIRFRMEFETELEFSETLNSTIDKYKIQH